MILIYKMFIILYYNCGGLIQIMSNIITFHDYNWRKGDYMNLSEILKDLTKKNNIGYEYTLVEIRQLANNILNTTKYYSGRCATPIVKIAKDFDFKTYKEHLKESGDININGGTLKKYGHNKVILVNRNDELFHQRFVVAHELAHYLFDMYQQIKYLYLHI